ncbi:MAG: YncE family protein, partial [Solirubrobacterales bacterium]
KKGKGKKKGKARGKGKKKGKAKRKGACGRRAPSPVAPTPPATGPAAPGAGPASPGTGPVPPGLAEVILVGNNWDGTADVIEVRNRARRNRPGYRRVTRLNIVPDLQERLFEILLNPVDLAYFLAIRLLVGEGNDQYVDDLYTTPDGRLLVVSRPSLKDVVGIELETGEIAWRFEVAGQRSDHMGISPDGRHVAVSASTGNVVHILDTETGKQVGAFPSGDSPHENTYSEDGERIYHASIGLVYTPLDQPLLDTTKGDRWFQVVDAETTDILKRIDIGQKLAQAGHPDMSSAVRPMAITADERRIYMQVSFFHGFVEYDNVNDRVLRLAHLPDFTGGLPRELYLLDSAHHGIAIDGDDRRLCVAGTMSDYAAIVDRRDFGDRTLITGEGTKPYWSTTSEDGRFCYVSWSGTDSISVIDYKTREVIANLPVGDHPQRVRTGHVPQSFIDAHRD